MTFEQLYHFLEVYRYGSITKAANNLGISRQAVSNSIKKLEREFNIVLFERFANGTCSTKAGEILYNHATNIINEESAIRQKFLSFTPQSNSRSIYKIGLAESLLLNIGEELLDKLSTTFPDSYFDISAFIFDPSLPSQYKLYDFSVPILFDTQYEQMFNSSDLDDFTIIDLDHFPAYVWISADSPFNQYESLNFSLLKKTPYCVLKNSYNITNMLQRISDYFSGETANGTEVYLKNNFVENIERFGYYTVDFPIIKNKFFYEDIMKNHNVILKKTDVFLSKKIIYNKNTFRNLYPIIISILT